MKGKVQNDRGIYDQTSNPAWQQRLGKAYYKKQFTKARRMNKS